MIQLIQIFILLTLANIGVKTTVEKIICNVYLAINVSKYVKTSDENSLRYRKSVLKCERMFSKENFDF